MDALKIKEYADIVISHAVSGFEFVKQCPLPTLLVAQLSNNNNLIDQTYTERCIKEAHNNKNIIGFISQENLGYNKCIYCKPGIRLDTTTDSYDQKYSGKSNGIDYYIVGRGITQSDNINETTIFYKNNLQ